MNRCKRIFLLSALVLFSITVPAQQLPPLPVDPAIRQGTLGCGATYYMVEAPFRKGFGSIALVQQEDSLTPEKRAQLSSAFLARMGVGPRQEGFLQAKERSTVYRFQDIPFHRPEVLDSMLLYTFTQMARSRAPQAVIVSGDIDPVELKKKMDIFSLLVQPLPKPAPVQTAQWDPARLPELDYTQAPASEVSVTYAGSRIPSIFMNTAQALVTDIFGVQFLVLLQHRLEKDLNASGIPWADIRFGSLRSADYSGNERYSVSVRVAPGRERDALCVLARTLGSLDATGISVEEFTDVKEVISPTFYRAPSQGSDQVDRCIAHYLYGANLAPASERLRLFLRKNVPPATETRLLNKFVSALLGGEHNLSLALEAPDSLVVEEALLHYNAHYHNAEAVPTVADYTWHGADTLGLEVAPPRVRIQKEKADPISGGTLWTFSNGMRVLFKQVKGSGMFNYALVLNGGLSLIPDLQEGEGGHIAAMLRLYDAGGLPAPVFRDLLQVHGVSMNADLQLSALTLSGDAPSAKLALLLKTFISLARERVPNPAEFARYQQTQALMPPATDDILYGLLNPGFRYTSRKGALTPDTQRKAEAYFADRFIRMNDGILILSGDLDEGVVKRLLGRYLGGFPTLKGTAGRKPVEFRPRSGSLTVTGTDAPRGIHILLDGPCAITSDNFYLSFVAARALEANLIRFLAPYGFTAQVRAGYMVQPQERFRLFVTCLPVAPEGLPAEIPEADVDRALTAIRAAIADASRRQPAAADVAAWKAALLQQVKAAMAVPAGFTAMLTARYAINKDVITRYQESIAAITPARVSSFIGTVSGGSGVEYLVP